MKGINETKKRRDIFTWLRKKAYDICLLQETHSTKDLEQVWENEWGYKCFFSSFSGQSRGAAILFNNTFEYTIHKITKDEEGRCVILDLTINAQRLTLGNVYGPNDDNPVFFNMIQTKLGDHDNGLTILGGDFNVVQDYSLDISNIRNQNNPKAHEKVNNMKEELDLYDPWRLQNPDTKTFTWNNSRQQQSRLDYFLISGEALNFIESTLIKPGYRSDHSLIEIKLKLTQQVKGPGLWKFNNSLLKDDTYVNEVKTCIAKVHNQYYDNNNRLTIGDQLFFEMLKLEIRGKTIAYTAAKKKELNLQEKTLDQRIDTLHKAFCMDPSYDNLNKLTEAQNDLKILREKKVEGIITRAKARWHLEGERNSKYFCNLEKRHYTEKTIPKLVDKNGQEINDIKGILKEQKSFYEDLYTSKKPALNVEDRNLFFPDHNNIRKLSVEEALTMEEEITSEECYKVLKNMKTCKSPGSDGYTVEFYLHFWNDLNTAMLKSFKQTFNNEMLSSSQKLGIITCLPKPGKPKEYIKNWRPISLLNVDYKILSSVIANRIKLFLDPLISNSQKGFISGRYIGECTRLVSDIIFKLKKKNMTGIILLIDFEKAFDSLEWSFINKTLSYFNFGEKIKKWVKILYSDIESCVINNGHSSDRFKLSRGVRQGDPLSPYLFILATEILASTIMSHENIKGIKIDDSEYLITQLADDTTLMLENDELSFKTCMNIIENFSKISGLKINYSKTLAVKIGMDEDIQYKLDNKMEITWQSEGKFTLLGIHYNLDQDDFLMNNYESKIKEFERTLHAWISRKLTIFGKVCIIKSLALPKMVHLFSSLPDPPEDIFTKLNSIAFKFIWGGKIEKIKRTTMFNTYENGGFKVPNFKLFCKAQKISWIKKLLEDVNISDWKTLLLSDIEKYGGNYIWLCENSKPLFINSLNVFWKDVYYAWTTLGSKITDPDELPHRQLLFHNNCIKIDHKTIFHNDWYTKGIRYINDLLNENGDFYTWEDFSAKYEIFNQPFKLFAIIDAIPRNWKKRIKDSNIKLNENNIQHPKIQKIKHLKKPGKYFYMVAIEKLVTRAERAELKWQNLIEEELTESDWQKIYSLPYKVTKETKLRFLQLKLIHQIIPTNNWLFKCKLIDSKSCTFCNFQNESIDHLFWYCPNSKNLWLKLAEWLNIQPFTFKQAILGDPNNQTFIEHIKLITKEHIYYSKVSEKQPNFKSLLQTLKFKINIEYFYNKNKAEFELKWARDVLLKLQVI